MAPNTGGVNSFGPCFLSQMIHKYVSVAIWVEIVLEITFLSLPEQLGCLEHKKGEFLQNETKEEVRKRVMIDNE